MIFEQLFQRQWPLRWTETLPSFVTEPSSAVDLPTVHSIMCLDGLQGTRTAFSNFTTRKYLFFLICNL